MSSSETFRPKSGWALFCAAVVLAGFWLWSVVLTGSASDIIATALWALAVLVGIYLISVRPKIIFSDSCIEIINPLQHVRIGWGDVTNVGAKWALEVESIHGKFSAWAAPAPSRFHSKKIDQSELKSMRIAGEESIFAAHSPKSDSGIALHIAQIHRSAFTGGDTEFKVSRNYSGVLVMAVCVCAAIVIYVAG